MPAWAAGAWATGAWRGTAWADVGVTVPDVVGELQADGTTTLEGAGFVVAVQTAYSSAVPAGTIISQSPGAGAEVPAGSTVTITVSLGDAPSQDTVTGGWWPDYEHIRRQRLKRQREIEEAEEQAKLVQDELDRQIYLAQRKHEAEEADRADLERLQRLADHYAGKTPDLPKPVAMAIWNAQDVRTRNALEQMRRMIEQMLDDELIAITQIVLLMSD
jgi:hypothetical protein